MADWILDKWYKKLFYVLGIVLAVSPFVLFILALVLGLIRGGTS